MKLTLKKIDNILKTIKEMREYKYELLSDYSYWFQYTYFKMLYVIRVEIITMWKIYLDAGIEIPLDNLPPMNIISDDAFNEMNNLNSLIEFFTFPCIDLQEKGWIEIPIKLDDECLDYDPEEEMFIGKTEEECINLVFHNQFGKFAEVFPHILEVLQHTAGGIFVPEHTYLMKSERMGKFLEFADKNSKVKKTKLYNNIMQCLNDIVEPFEIYYPHCDKYKVKDGCLYAFFTAGDYSENDGEFVGLIHGKLSRYLCIEMLDILLQKAEERYGYLDNGS